MDNNKYISSINVNNTKYPISSSKMNNIDTQYKENNPQWYITNYSNSVVSETNKNSVVSSPFSSTYCTITTYIPSNGNGYPKQILLDTDTNNMAIRNGISNTEWSKWSNYYTKEEINGLFTEVPVTETGTYISTDMVSEVEHNVKCNIERINLFNINSEKKGYSLKVSTGEIITASDFNTSDFIKVKSNTIYTISHCRMICFYDVNKKFISGDDPTSTIIKIYTTPETCSYIRFTYGTPKDNVQVNEGSSLLPYTPYVPYLQRVKINRYGKNISYMFKSSILGLDYSENEDGSSNFKGKFTYDYRYAKGIDAIIPKGIYLSSSVTFDQNSDKYSASIGPVLYHDDKIIAQWNTLSSGDSDVRYLSEDVNNIGFIIAFRGDINKGDEIELTNIKLMLEFGIKSSKWEKVQSKSLQFNNNISNMTSISPYMTILSDTPGVNITATYNANTSKYIESNNVLTQQQLKSAHDLEIYRQQDYVDESLVRMVSTTESGTSISTYIVSDIEHQIDCKVERINLLNYDKLQGDNIEVKGNGTIIVTPDEIGGGCPTTLIANNFIDVNKITTGDTIILNADTNSSINYCYSVGDSKVIIFGKPYIVTNNTFSKVLSFYGNGIDTQPNEIKNIRLYKGVDIGFVPYVPDLSNVNIYQTKNLLNTHLLKSHGNHSGMTREVIGDKVHIYGTGNRISYFSLTEYNADGKTPIPSYLYNKRVKLKVFGSKKKLKYDLMLFNKNKELINYIGENTEIEFKQGYFSIRATFSTYTYDETVQVMLYSGNEPNEYYPFNFDYFTPSLDGTVSNMTSISPYMNILTDTPGVNITATYGSDVSKYKQVYGNITKELAKESVDFVNSHVVTESTKKYIEDNTIPKPKVEGTRGQFALSDGNGGIMFETFINRADIGL